MSVEPQRYVVVGDLVEATEPAPDNVVKWEDHFATLARVNIESEIRAVRQWLGWTFGHLRDDGQLSNLMRDVIRAELLKLIDETVHE